MNYSELIALWPVMKLLLSVAGAIAFSASVSGCGVSYGDFRAGSPGYLEELRQIEQLRVYDSRGQVRTLSGGR